MAESPVKTRSLLMTIPRKSGSTSRSTALFHKEFFNDPVTVGFSFDLIELFSLILSMVERSKKEFCETEDLELATKVSGQLRNARIKSNDLKKYQTTLTSSLLPSRVFCCFVFVALDFIALFLIFLDEISSNRKTEKKRRGI